MIDQFLTSKFAVFLVINLVLLGTFGYLMTRKGPALVFFEGKMVAHVAFRCDHHLDG
jgi:hypothetical protein